MLLFISPQGIETVTAWNRSMNPKVTVESQGDSWIPRWQLNPKVRLLPYLYGLFPFIQIKVSECARLFELKRNRTITTISNLMDGLCWIKLNKVKKGKEMSAENERTLSSPLI